MPLMIGDWLKGTAGMSAEERGVYLNLLIYQHENGFIPNDLKRLSLIDSEVGNVWVSIRCKFVEFENGKLRNEKLVKILDFWDKQSKNGKKGGRPKKQKPKENPEHNPNINHHNDIDLDNENDIELMLKESLDEIYLDQERMKWKNIDFDFELDSFKSKVIGSQEHYANHNKSGIRLAFQSQLRNAKKINGKPKTQLVDLTNL